MKQDLKARFVGVVGAAVLALCGCGGGGEESGETGRLRVVASFLPVQSHAAAIAGEYAMVEQLLAKDTGPHDYHLTPGDVRKLAEADLFLVNGLGLEAWLDEIVEKAGVPELVVVELSEGLGMGEGPEEWGGGGDGGGENPHVWLDPVLAKRQAAVVLEALREADPGNARGYEENAARYMAELEALDLEYRTVLGGLRNKNLVTFHDAFPYLAERYGLNYVGYISGFPEKDPPPRELAELVDRIRVAGVGVLFAESGYAPDLLREIARQTGARVSELDTLEVGVGDGGAYLTRMRANLEALREAFQGEEGS